MKNNNFDYVVVGGGPAGIFFAYEKNKLNPESKILIIERGKAIEDRKCPAEKTRKCMKCQPHCHVTNGFSGAGAFSDAKFNMFNPEDEDFPIGGNLHAYIGVPETKRLIEYVDKVNCTFLTPPKMEGVENKTEIAKLKKKAISANLELPSVPIRHWGTDNARVLYMAFEQYLKNTSVEMRMETEVVELLEKNNEIIGVKCSNNEIVYAKNVIIAVGRAGADWFERMCKEHNIRTKAAMVDIGVRYELSNAVMQQINDNMYEAKLIGHPNPFNDKVRTFCQNPSGKVAIENESGITLVNGHSSKKEEDRTANTNLAILVSIELPDIKQPMEYVRNIGRTVNALSNGKALVQRLGDIKEGRATLQEDLEKNSVMPTCEAYVPGNICLGMPYNIVVDIINFIEMVENVIPGFAGDDNLLYSPELKFYSNKVELNEKMETSIKGLYAIGDGCGTTRGLSMASASGVFLARNI